MPMRIALVFLVVVALAGAAAFAYINKELDAQSVILDFDRSYGMCYLCSVDVFVNGAKVGVVGGAKTKKFRLRTTPENLYSISARLIPLIGPNLSTDTKTISAQPGSIVYARFEVHPWVFKVLADVKLEVAIEKNASRVLSYIPAALSASGAKIVAEHRDPWLGVRWDIIESISAVVAGIAGVLALFKK